MGDIAYQNKDVASKTTSERLIGKSLAPFGLEHLRIVDILPTNLPRSRATNCIWIIYFFSVMVHLQSLTMSPSSAGKIL